MDRTSRLIAQLSRELRPVRRLLNPDARALLWIVSVFSTLGIYAGLHGLRPDIGEVFAQPAFTTEWIAALLTGVSAATAAFHLSVPGCSKRWIYIPVPATVVWVLTFVRGIFLETMSLGWDEVRIPESWSCVRFIGITSILLSVLMLWLLRHASYSRKSEIVVFSILSVAAMASANQDLFHSLHRAVSVLVWHGGTIFVLLWAYSLVGPWLLDRFERTAVGRST